MAIIAALIFLIISIRLLAVTWPDSSARWRSLPTCARWLRSSCGDYVHASSSCAIGRVLDDDGRVGGYRSLYVCDASAFPSIPATNTHLPTTMLAERLVARWP